MVVIQSRNLAPSKVIERKCKVVFNSPGRISKMSFTSNVTERLGGADSCVWNEEQKQQNVLPGCDVKLLQRTLLFSPDSNGTKEHGTGPGFPCSWLLFTLYSSSLLHSHLFLFNLTVKFYGSC